MCNVLFATNIYMDNNPLLSINKSRRLGGLYRLFQATILLYIASSIIYQQRYLKTENVINGNFFLSLIVDVFALPCLAPTCMHCLHNAQ